MKTLTKSLIVAALAASTVSQAAVVTFSGTLSSVSNPSSTGYSGTYSGSYDISANTLDLSVIAAGVLSQATSGDPSPIVSGVITAAGGYSAALSIGPGAIQHNPYTLTVTLVTPPITVNVPMYLNVQGFAGAASGVTAVGTNPTTPTTYTITLNNASGAALTGTFTAVPEPEVYAGVAALGLAGFALWRRRNA